jgi:hypothetical protein
LVTSQRLRSLFDFENKLQLFPAVAPVVRFCLLTTGSANPSASGASFVFFAHTVDSLNEAGRKFTLTSADIALINPNTSTCPIFKSESEAEITKRIYARFPVLIRHTPSRNPWNVFLKQGLFNMTSDSGNFRTKAELCASGYALNGNVFASPECSYLPLYEAKLVQQFDHRRGTFAGLESEAIFNTKAATISPGEEAKRSPDLVALPRYWVSDKLVDAAAPEFWKNAWLISFRDIIQAMTNARCAIFTVIPRVAVSNKLPLLFPRISDCGLMAALLANLNSFVFDFNTRQKIGGTSLNFYILEQLPVLPPATYAEPCAWACQPTTALRDWLLPRVIELTYTAWDLEPFARDCGWFGPPFVWDEARRFQLRCELDAAFFHLYGLSRADADYVLDTFPIVRRKDNERHNGDYRTKRVILEIYDSLQEAIKTAQPYQTPLAPPPGPPLDATGKFVNYPEIGANPPPHIHLPREHVDHSGERHLSDLSLGFPSTPFVVRLGTTPGAARIRVTPALTDELKVGERIILATPTLRLHGAAVPAAIGKLGIEFRTDAASGERYVLVSVRGKDGIAQTRLSEAEWKVFRTVGRADDLA